MKWLVQSVRNKILAVVGAGIGIVAIAGFYAYLLALSGFAAMVRVNETQVASAAMIQTAQTRFKEQVQDWKDVLLRGHDAAALEKYWSQFVEAEKDVRERTQRLRDTAQNAEVRDILGRFLVAHEEMGRKYREGLEAFKKAGFDHKAGDAAVKGIDRAPTDLLTQAADWVRGDADSTVAAVQRDVAGKLNLMLIVAGAAIAGAGLLSAILLVRMVVRPLGAAVHVARSVAQGDLTVRAASSSRDETGMLLHALQEMGDGLSRSVSSIRAAAESVGSASKQIASGNADLSARTEQQASSLEEAASSMEELMTTVKLNAENARQASQLALGASDTASDGGRLMDEVVGTMGGISAASRKIGDIIGVIDGIAFQTNILALNAAVEAARAGEQGRGFAVVAAEVRGLAQRSAAAAKEIRDLIQASVARVDGGTALVENAGSKMGEIVSAIKRVSDVVSEISAASQEQITGIEQVSRAVTQMDQVVQQNAALVEESASASESMAAQAEHLIQSVAGFKIEERSAGAPRVEPVALRVGSVAAPLKAQDAPRLAPKPAKKQAQPRHRDAPRPAAAMLKARRTDTVPANSEGDWQEF